MEPITSLIQSPLFTKLFGPLVIVAVVGLFWWRAGSIHTVLERLWRLAAGKAEIQDPVLKEFIQETRDLEKFRFIYGLKIETKVDLHRLLAWRERNAIDIGRVQKARRWINIRTTNVINPSPDRYFYGKAVIVLVYALMSIAASEVFSSKFAFLQMRTSKSLFLTDAKTIHHVFGRWTIELELCSKEPAQITMLTGFLKTETSSLCRAFNGESLKRMVDVTLQQQRIASATIGVIAMLFLVGNILRIRSAEEARKIKKHLTSSTVTPTNELKLLSPAPIVADIRKNRRKRKSSGTPGESGSP